MFIIDVLKLTRQQDQDIIRRENVFSSVSSTRKSSAHASSSISNQRKFGPLPADISFTVPKPVLNAPAPASPPGKSSSKRNSFDYHPESFSDSENEFLGSQPQVGLEDAVEIRCGIPYRAVESTPHHQQQVQSQHQSREVNGETDGIAMGGAPFSELCSNEHELHPHLLAAQNTITILDVGIRRIQERLNQLECQLETLQGQSSKACEVNKTLKIRCEVCKTEI
jgi:hypothetical protein